MGSKSRSVQKSVSTDLHTDGGSFCDALQQSATPVCIASPRSLGSGIRRNECRVEREVPVRISSHSHGSSSGRQTSTGSKRRNVVSSTTLGNKSSLPQASAIKHSSTREVASTSISVKATSSKGVSSKTSGSESSCILAEDLRRQGFDDDEVIDRVLRPLRKKSQSCYEAKWNIFVEHCKRKGIVPMNITIPQLANFFNYLFRKGGISVDGLQVVTINGYRSALNSRLSHRLGNLSLNVELRKLFQSFKRDRPRTLRLVQPWDLTLVLRALTQHPFEPIDSISIKFLTWKTAFLIALATGRRCCEIHAIRRSKIFFTEDWSSVTFNIDHFLCKNQEYEADGDMFKSATIPALGPTLDQSLEEDITLCPVRALKYYLERVEHNGKTFKYKALFVPLKDTGRELCKATFSNWIKNCVRHILSNCSTENAQLHYVRAHDIRSMGASWCLKSGYALKDIMRACTWRNHLTFTRFYLKDSVENLVGEHRLGYFVAAQAIVQH